jgi:hypothetical protein
MMFLFMAAIALMTMGLSLPSWMLMSQFAWTLGAFLFVAHTSWHAGRDYGVETERKRLSSVMVMRIEGPTKADG